jgi:hypothetical protein
MDKTENYLLLLIGILVVALIAVELIPIPEAPVMVQAGEEAPSGPTFKPARISSASIASAIVIPTSTLATVTVS